MYGEDIDLSWRLVEGGWENHYCANTSIIHYKENPPRRATSTTSYLLSAALFAAKHFEGRQARAFLMIRWRFTSGPLAILRRTFTRWGNLAVVTFGTLAWLLATMLGIQAWGKKLFMYLTRTSGRLVLVQISTTLALEATATPDLLVILWACVGMAGLFHADAGGVCCS